jgi:hypothetical protein
MVCLYCCSILYASNTLYFTKLAKNTKKRVVLYVLFSTFALNKFSATFVATRQNLSKLSSALAAPNVAKSKIDKETKGCLLVYQKAEMIPSNLMQLVLP